MAKVGGVGASKAATAEIQTIFKDVHGEVPAKVSELKDVKGGEAVSYATQVVAGTNYFIKVKYTKDDASVVYAHLRVFKGLGAGVAVKLVSVQYPKAEDDPLNYF